MDVVDDVGVDGGAVTVGEGEHGVEVHRGPQLGHPSHDDPLGRACRKQRGRDLADGLPGTALAHADEHDSVADRHHVSTLECGQAPVSFWVAPPDGDAGIREVGMEGVDGLHQQGLVVARGPVEGVERHAAVYPAGGVARVQGVRQRRHEVLPHAGLFAGERDVGGTEVAGQVGRGQPADQVPGERAGLQAVQERPRLVDQAEPHLVGDDLPVQEPRLRIGVGEYLGQEIVQLDDLHPAFAHLGDEVEMVPLGALHPQDVVEQEVVAVGRGEPVVGEPGCADQDLAQLADLGMGAVDRPGRRGVSHVVPPE